MSLLRVLAPLVSLACCGVAFAQQPNSPDGNLPGRNLPEDGQSQFALIRPTHRLIADDQRTVRRTRTASGVPQRKSGNIAPLKRDLPKAVVQPPKTRRRVLPW
ncbi:MAG TPA: hypothetical protein VGN42_05815 [Pirellulales bacterium]|jgi:hypothetical protein|nr:hypothetical protein [Pirellulales bacterium]